MVSENDLWEGGNVELDPDDYVLVGQEDIMDGIASFMAAYLLSLKQTKVSLSFFVASFWDESSWHFWRRKYLLIPAFL